MTKISTYSIDTDVTGSDKWIGTDSQNFNLTKNFTPVKLAKYFNNSEIISIGSNLRYVYDILEVGEDRKYGTITFDPQEGSSVLFSTITTFILSKFTTGGKDVEQYITKLPGSQIIICNADNPNSFGVFDIQSVTQIILEPNFYTVTLDFVDGYGNLVEDKAYSMQLIRFGELPASGVSSVTGNIVDNTDPENPIVTQVQPDWNATEGVAEILNKPTIPTKTSDLTNDGQNGINPFITAADVPVSNLQEVLNSGSTATFTHPVSGETITYDLPADDGLNYYTNIFHADPIYQSGLSINQGIVSLSSSQQISGTEYHSIQLTCPPPVPIANEYNNVLNLFSSNTPNEGFYGVLVPTPNFTQNTGIYFPIKPTGDYTLATIDDIPSVSGYVPYTGATQDVDLGEHELKAGQIEFDQSPTGTSGTAIMRWNDTDGTLDLGLKGGNVTLQVGQENVVRVVNKTGGNLLESNYQVVRVRLVSEGGAAGQRLAVVLAQANNDTNSATTLGIVTENINNNQEGFITVFGSVREVNTTGSLQGETWVDGDILYLSPTTPGQLTNIKPSAPQHLVTVGYVEYAHAIHGKIFVKVDNGYELDELHNVDITSPVNNDVLTYNSSTQVWENKGITTALGYTPQVQLNGTGFVKASGTTITYDNSTYLTSSTVITNVEKNAYEYRCSVLTSTTATQIGQPGAGIVTQGIAAATQGGGKFKSQNRFNYTTATLAGSLAFFRTTFGLISLNTGFVCEWLFGTADAATVAGARSFVGFTGNFASPNNVEPTSLVNCVGLARLSTSNNWHIIHNDASGVCTSIDLGSGYPSNTLEIDLIYLRLTFNTDSTISYLVANKTTNISTSGTLSTNLPAVLLYETIWTTNNATALAARLGFCYRTFNNPY